MAPHAMETILQPPQWPLGLSSFVTWCLMWDPKNRPTSKQALEHEFFADAVDPLRPKSSSRLLGRKHSDLSFKSKDSTETNVSTSKPSWFRRSLIARESAAAVPQQDSNHRYVIGVPQPEPENSSVKVRPQANKRATWTHGATGAPGAPMPILPSIKPVSPLQNAVTAQALSRLPPNEATKIDPEQEKDTRSKRLGRQLSVNSPGNHYADLHRQEAERALNGNTSNSGLMSPPYQKEGFFSHLRKKARRFSGRHGITSPNPEDVEATAAAMPWSNRSSMIVDSIIPEAHNDFADLDKALASVRYSLDRSLATPEENHHTVTKSTISPLKRTHSVQNGTRTRSTENLNHNVAPVVARTRRALQISTNPVHHYETPEEADELLDEVLTSTTQASHRFNQMQRQEDQKRRSVLLQRDHNRVSMPQLRTNFVYSNTQSYPTPSPSAKEGVSFNEYSPTTKPLNITKQRPENDHAPSYWPTPPNEESEWARAAAANAFASHSGFR